MIYKYVILNSVSIPGASYPVAVANTRQEAEEIASHLFSYTEQQLVESIVAVVLITSGRKNMNGDPNA